MPTLPIEPVSAKLEVDSETATDLVNARWAATLDVRLKAVLESMVKQAEQMAEFGASEPFYLIEFDITLTRQ